MSLLTHQRFNKLLIKLIININEKVIKKNTYGPQKL